jgi:hypothetical protein
MAGLDPAIHLKNYVTVVWMDCRVKPGNDDFDGSAIIASFVE